MTMQQPDHRGRVLHRTNARAERFCNGCRMWLAADAFAPVERGIGGRAAACRPCAQRRQKVRVGTRYAANPDLYAKSLETARRCYRRRAQSEYRDRLVLAEVALSAMRGAGWSWAEISRRAGVSLHAISGIRNGEQRYVRRSTTRKLIEAARATRGA